MAYLALYRKYRPSSFEDVVGQDKVVKVLKHAIASNKISHAYLFAGPRGTGKTTMAKLIARMVNCQNPVDGEPCGKCENCLRGVSLNEDVIEIDAASNNGVDEIRELRDKVSLVPTKSKYKIYIIDEVHMLTTGAFNALLKTLEEPPAHAIFILATTELHKIPITVASRCQKFQFTKLSMDDMFSRLKFIASKENIVISDDAIYEIARLSDGGMRDAINLLDQLTAYKDDPITVCDVHEINGTVSYIEMNKLMVDIKHHDTMNILDFLDILDKNGKDILRFSEELLIFIKDAILCRNTNVQKMILDKKEKIDEINKLYSDFELYDFLEELNETINNVRLSNFPLIILEVFFLKISDKLGNKTDSNYTSEKTSNEPVKAKNIINDNQSNFNVVKEEKKNVKKNTQNEVEIRINNAFATANKEILKSIRSNWNKINDYLLDQTYGVIAGILKDTSVLVAGDEYLILLGNYSSVVDRVNLEMEDVTNFLNNVLGSLYKCVALTQEEWLKERETYIKNIKNGIKYSLKKEKVQENINNEKNDLDDLISTFGSDMIEYR